MSKEKFPRKPEHRKRLLYLDSVRGFCTMIIIVAHAFSHLMFWDMNLIPLEEVSIIAIIILAPVIILATSAPAFVLFSASALSYNFYLDIKEFIKFKSENIPNQKTQIDISFKDPALSRIVKKNLISYLVLLVASLAHVFLFHYGLNWNGRVQRTLLTGILETGSFTSIDYEVFFQTDAIGLIAISGIFNVGLIVLLLRKQGYYKPKRNLLILLGLIIVWYILSPLFHNLLDDLFWQSLNDGRYGITLLLKFIVGPPMSIFPNFAFGFAGIIYGFGFAQEQSRAFFRKLALYFSILFISVSGTLILINGFNLSPESFGLFLPLELQILDFAVIQILVIIFIEIIKYSKKSKNEITKSTRIWQRLGNVTMTAYIFESVLCILNMKWYIPLWEKLPQSSLILHLEVFIFVGMQFALWYGIILLWEKKNFKFSVEWFTKIIRKKLVKNNKKK
ncbi:DUF418 domain-containing protein [Promethearchaeum syntrophicum]|uniref:DUF418 domain-containing protein n=1 Tax=Promethearchaeum syntrophicum TaxID=2594042 RepID=A0A5B9D9X9_9ARCH|nr:DUF418 domain-containing protein [Candidatus Prometheoarchaeum syntrophicum]QEE15735.1 hypothetical protein DSAG12_01562 [Candidatus Prometheoarchaeum syntrophicum]